MENEREDKCMYEKLDKLRADLDRARQRKADAEAKVKQAEEKLREAENSQVLADVSALKLTPEQVAQFLQMAAAGQLQNAGAAFGGQSSAGYQNVNASGKAAGTEKNESGKDVEDDEIEDYDHDENEDE